MPLPYDRLRNKSSSVIPRAVEGSHGFNRRKCQDDTGGYGIRPYDFVYLNSFASANIFILHFEQQLNKLEFTREYL